ncbi:gamma-tubulin complex component 4 [Cylas formicarius]|uniref:gamma-tubulin complex component 4 n=1 Tax=Cylas formicarius TaxID=197179 RepID=UPI0029589D7A|nr:gamma-tubulin complex component 4 [Cylas formicarius]
MIHELLLHLWNNPAIVGEGDENNYSNLFELPQFLHPGEHKLLHKIIEIAANYHKIVSYVNNVLGQNQSELEPTLTENSSNQLYLKAFCNGIQSVLEDYREEILRLENMFLEHPRLSLTFVLSSVDKYRGVFGILQAIIRQVQGENLKGCLLLNSLHKYVNCGVEEYEEATNKVIKCINTVFYQHLCNWIIYGDLVDPCNEFFVCDGNVPDENFLYPEQGNGGETISIRSKICRPPNVRKFFINWNMLPMFITEDCAESILFMGRIVWIVRNKPAVTEKISDYQTKFKKDVWEGRDMEYYLKIQALNAQNFNAVEFRKTLEECRIKLTKHLWSLMLEEGNLTEHLTLIRDYYALGRGELFQQFLSVSAASLADIPADSIMHHINFVFQETARKIYGENDKSYSRFELDSPSIEISRVNPWQRLQLNFEITWPLHIVFHPQVMALYNKLFSFLLRLKKTQINLHKVWSSHTFSQQMIDRRVWMLRQNLMFLVDNLQYYVQVNVIEAQFSLLLKAVKTANEFEDIIKVHQEFVVNLLSKAFLLMPDESQKSGSKHRLYQMPALQNNVPSKVYDVIIKLLELCDQFCLAASTWKGEITEADLEGLEAFQKKTDTTIESLLIVLYTLHEKVSGGHLLQLLLHLDFNKYFSKNRMDLNLTNILKF